MKQGLEVVNGGDHRAAKRGIPAQSAILHRAANPLYRGRDLREARQLCHRRGAAECSSDALHRIGVRPGRTAAEEHSVELFHVIACLEYEELEKSRPFGHARSMGLRVTKLGRRTSGVHGGT